jgi:hypothetical protein
MLAGCIGATEDLLQRLAGSDSLRKRLAGEMENA